MTVLQESLCLAIRLTARSVLVIQAIYPITSLTLTAGTIQTGFIAETLFHGVKTSSIKVSDIAQWPVERK